MIVVSASLIELVEPLARRLELDGAMGTRAEIRDGRFTGQVDSFLHGQTKADAVRGYAAAHDIDLSCSSAYTDSRSDMQLLEVVGHAYAVNPDRTLAKTARVRGWPVVRFG